MLILFIFGVFTQLILYLHLHAVISSTISSIFQGASRVGVILAITIAGLVVIVVPIVICVAIICCVLCIAGARGAAAGRIQSTRTINVAPAEVPAATSSTTASSVKPAYPPNITLQQEPPPSYFNGNEYSQQQSWEYPLQHVGAHSQPTRTYPAHPIGAHSQPAQVYPPQPQGAHQPAGLYPPHLEEMHSQLSGSHSPGGGNIPKLISVNPPLSEGPYNPLLTQDYQATLASSALSQSPIPSAPDLGHYQLEPYSLCYLRQESNLPSESDSKEPTNLHH